MTIGATSDGYSVATPVALSTNTTWNPADKDASIVLSNGNRTSNKPGAAVPKILRSTTSKTSGKRYAEFTIGGTGGGGDAVSAGLANATASLASGIGNSGNSMGYSSDGGQPGCGFAGPGAFNAGDILCLAIDLDNNKLWGRINNGAWSASGDPVTGTNGSSTSGLGSTKYLMGGHDWPNPTNTINGGQTAFTYSPPTGYSAWDL